MDTSSLCTAFPDDFIFNCDIPTERRDVAIFLRQCMQHAMQSPARAVVIRPNNRSQPNSEVDESDDEDEESDEKRWQIISTVMLKANTGYYTKRSERRCVTSFSDMVYETENKGMKFDQKNIVIDANSKESRIAMDKALNEYHEERIKRKEVSSVVAESTKDLIIDSALIRDGTLWGVRVLLEEMHRNEIEDDDEDVIMRLHDTNEKGITKGENASYKSIVELGGAIQRDHYAEFDLATCNEALCGMKKWYFVDAKLYEKHTEEVYGSCPTLLCGGELFFNKSLLKEKIEENNEGTLYEYVQVEGEIIILASGCVFGSYAVRTTYSCSINFGTFNDSKVLERIKEEKDHRERRRQDIQRIMTKWNIRKQETDYDNKYKQAMDQAIIDCIQNWVLPNESTVYAYKAINEFNKKEMLNIVKNEECCACITELFEDCYDSHYEESIITTKNQNGECIEELDETRNDCEFNEVTWEKELSYFGDQMLDNFVSKDLGTKYKGYLEEIQNEWKYDGEYGTGYHLPESKMKRLNRNGKSKKKTRDSKSKKKTSRDSKSKK